MIEGISGTTSKAQMNINRIIEYAGTVHKYREVVSMTSEGCFRYTYGEMYERVGKLARLLDDLGVGGGEVVTVFGANTHTTVEAIYAVPGLGATVYTANPRIPFEHLISCMQHVSNNAPSRIAIIEPIHMELVGQLIENLGGGFDHYLVLGSSRDLVDTPPFAPVSFTEDLIPSREGLYDWQEVDEDTAAIIMFTTGTVGQPKPIAHSHRMIWLHSVGMCASLSINAQDTVLVLPPIYHLGWLLWSEAPFVGAQMILPGANPSPEEYVKLILDEKVSFTAAVPTLFAVMVDKFKEREANLSDLRIYFAGQATPESLISEYDAMGADARQLYGFSEAGPHFVENIPRPLSAPSGPEENVRFKASVSGFPACGSAIKLVGESGEDLPWDGESFGTLAFRALWATTGYWKDPESTQEGNLDQDWMQVGDIGTIDPEGNVRVLDRAKDALKSGGEWIPTPLLENEIMRHGGVAEAVVVAASHPKWMERPIALVRPIAGQGNDVSEENIKLFLHESVERGAIKRWWVPDRIFTVDNIPRTSVGKFDKKAVRDEYRNSLT